MAKSKFETSWKHLNRDNKVNLKLLLLELTRDIKCFRCQKLDHVASQCPNKRAMTMNAFGKIESESEKDVEDDNDSMPELEDPSEGYEAVVEKRW